VAEKDEVVSLLLREFQENEADWLWQIDTNRRSARQPALRLALGRDPARSRRLVRPADRRQRVGERPVPAEPARPRRAAEAARELLEPAGPGRGRRPAPLVGAVGHADARRQGRFLGFRGVGSDVTEQRESDEKIAYLARYDTLTGLPNRLMLTEALGEAMRYAEQWKSHCAFLMIDLDRFKSVNDSLGHQVGDRLLAQVSLRLKEVIGGNEQCGRLGGDEFAIVIRDASDKDQVGRIADAVIDALSKPYDVDHHKLFIGASVGSAICPRDGDTVETLMRNADLALYRAKDEGGGVHCRYEASLHANAEERRKLEFALRHAIGNKELRLNFQPVVDTYSEQLVSFEALLRWHSEEHGAVSPGKFIPLAEDTRLIVPIGNWVLHEACRHAAAWQGDLKVAVNVSGEQLLEPGFASHVVHALADSGLPAHRLEVEVTESIFLRDARTARPDARGDHGAWLLDRARRLRHRVLVARLPPRAQVLDHQGRPQLRPGRRAGQPREPRDHPRRGRHGRQPRDDHDGRRCRDDRGSRADPRARLHQDPGLLLRPPDGSRGRPQAHQSAPTAPPQRNLFSPSDAGRRASARLGFLA
jgi:diguanylate cyclase (GGDEF)-like protein